MRISSYPPLNRVLFSLESSRCSWIQRWRAKASIHVGDAQFSDEMSNLEMFRWKRSARYSWPISVNGRSSLESESVRISFSLAPWRKLWTLATGSDHGNQSEEQPGASSSSWRVVSWYLSMWASEWVRSDHRVCSFPQMVVCTSLDRPSMVLDSTEASWTCAWWFLMTQ